MTPNKNPRRTNEGYINNPNKQYTHGQNEKMNTLSKVLDQKKTE